MTKTQVTSEQRVQEGDVVAYRYLIRSEEGQVLAASAEVVRYIQGGADTFPKALSEQFLGRRDGETFSVTLSPEEAFGPRAHPRQLTLPRDRFSELLTLGPGLRVDTKTHEGEQVSVWVVEAREHEVDVDFDHPLAGQRLRFEIAILSIRVATDADRTRLPAAEDEAQGVGAPEGQAPDSQAPEGQADGPSLATKLAELRRSLVEQFLAEESTGGLHDRMTRGSFGNDRRVQGMKDTHLALLDSLDGLAALVEDAEPGVDHRLALFALLQQIARHEHSESALLQESFQTDLGGEG